MLHCEDDNDPLSILLREEEQARIEEEQDQLEEKQVRDRERIAKVLAPGDFPVYGLSAMARKIGGVGRSPQWLHYGIKRKYPELAFLQQNPLHAMCSSLTNFDCALVETRVLKEQQDRGRARGQANRRPQIWHLSGPRSDD
jgi:hypothetical protein